MLRSVLSVVIGLATGVTIIDVVRSIGHAMYPPPAVVESGSSVMPAPGAFVMLLVAWWLGCSTGAGVAAYMASGPRWNHGWITAGLLFVYGLVQLFRVPQHPGWFIAATLVVFPLSAVVGMLIGTQPVPGKREGYLVPGPPDYSPDADEQMKMADQ